MVKQKTVKKSVSYIITVLLIVIMAFTGAISAIIALSRNGNNKLNSGGIQNDAADNIVADSPTLYSGEGVTYDLIYGNKLQVGTYGLADVVSNTAVNGVISKLSGLNNALSPTTLTLNYVLRVGEVTRDSFLVKGFAASFYPVPDADIIGIEHNEGQGHSTYIKFYGRMPGTTKTRIVNYAQGYNGDNIVSRAEYAIEINLTVVPNIENGKQMAHTKKATPSKIANRMVDINLSRSYTKSYTLASIIEQTSADYEIMAVGSSSRRMLTGGRWSGNTVCPLKQYSTTNANAALRGLRTGNRDIVFPTHGLTAATAYEIVVKHKDGYVDFIPFYFRCKSDSANTEARLKLTQATSRSRGVAPTGSATISAPDTVIENVATHQYGGDTTSWPASVFSGLTHVATFGKTWTTNNVSLTRPMGVNIHNYLDSGRDFNIDCYILPNLNWLFAPQPKNAASNTSATKINIATKAGLYVSASDFARINYTNDNANASTWASRNPGKNEMEIESIQSYDYGIINLALMQNRIKVSGGEDPAAIGMYNNRAEALIGVKNTNADSKGFGIISYITVYFSIAPSGLEGEGIWERNNLPNRTGDGSATKSTTRSSGEIGG